MSFTIVQSNLQWFSRARARTRARARILLPERLRFTENVLRLLINSRESDPDGYF